MEPPPYNPPPYIDYPYYPPDNERDSYYDREEDKPSDTTNDISNKPSPGDTNTSIPIANNPTDNTANTSVPTDEILTNQAQDNDIKKDYFPFEDVKDSDWFYEDVKYVYEEGLMNGIEETVFAPNDSTSRGMIVTILYRLEHEPETWEINPFDDVEHGKYYEKAITWANANGIVKGYGNGKFGPNDSITREQLAAILYRYAQYKGYDISSIEDLSKFIDYDEISHWATDALSWASADKLLVGKENNVLDPGGNAERCHVATVLRKLHKKIIDNMENRLTQKP